MAGPPNAEISASIASGMELGAAGVEGVAALAKRKDLAPVAVTALSGVFAGRGAGRVG